MSPEAGSSALERQRAQFQRLCDLPPEQAERELRALEERDSPLAQAVRALLEVDREARLRLDGLATDAVPPGLVGSPRTAGPQAPGRIGPYELLGLLGEGGMGVVYEAHQAVPERHVALKLLRPGLLSEDRLRRFQNEALALGRLNHPGIAQVYAAGTASTESGPQSFIAMELVRGERIDLHAQRLRLDVRGRLEWIAQLCDAVQHAHEKGVVHRDLKPANVLVSEEGALKVLDFGVARLAGADLESLTNLTGSGQVLGTLPYMSPEQVSGNPERVDARSDVYAIGVIAYELLTGQRPLDVSSRSLPEAARIIAQEEPSTLGRVDRRLRGDIEVIVAKALAKEPALRYASAGELAADLRRHLGDQPILARPPSRSYQLRKFARRHRELVLGATLAFAVLLAGALTSTALYLRSQDNLKRALLAEQDWRQAAQEARTNEQRAQAAELEWQEAARRARVETALSSEVTDFLVGLFEVSDPSGQAGAQVSALELLDRGRQDILSGLADQPEVRSRLMSVMGRVYFQLGQYAQAQPLIEATLETLRAEPDPDPLRLADALFFLGEIRHYRGLIQEVRPFYEEALELRRAHLPPTHPDLTYAIDVTARLFRDLGGRENLAHARELAEEAYELRLQAGAGDFELSRSLQTLGTLAALEGNVEEAIQLIEEALAIREQLSQERRDVAFRVPELLHALGTLENQRGDHDRAEELFTRCLELSIERFGPKHLFVSHSLRGLAMVKDDRGDYEGAERLLNQAEELTQEADLSMRNAVRHERAYLERALGDWDAAEALLREVIEDYESRLGRAHPYTAVALYDLGVLELDRGHLAPSEALLREALEILRASEPNNDALAPLLQVLGRVLRLGGQAEEAVACGLEAVQRCAQRWGAGSPGHRAAIQDLVESLEAAGESAQAADWRARL